MSFGNAVPWQTVFHVTLAAAVILFIKTYKQEHKELQQYHVDRQTRAAHKEMQFAFVRVDA